MNAPMTAVLAGRVAHRVLVPFASNFTPEARTPWGGTLIVPKYKSAHVQNAGVVGESWELSGHASFPNRFTVTDDERTFEATLPELCAAAPNEILGERLVAQHGLQLPYLVKLLNSASWQPSIKILRGLLMTLRMQAPEAAALWCRANECAKLEDCCTRTYHELHRALVSLLDVEWPSAVAEKIATIRTLHATMLQANLSIQVHPPRGYDAQLPSKTEAWVILDAEPGAGIYLGLRDGVTREQFQSVLGRAQTAAAAGATDFAQGDVSTLLNFLPVRAGDIFFIPPGTIHAIGAGVLLLEPQETSETTFRVFDWFRQPARQMHIAETLAVTTWDGLRGDAVVASYRCAPQLDAATGAELLVQVPEFSLRRWQLTTGQEFAGNTLETGIQGFVVLEGQVIVRVAADAAETMINAGQSFLLPAALGAYRIQAAGRGVVYGVAME